MEPVINISATCLIESGGKGVKYHRQAENGNILKVSNEDNHISGTSERILMMTAPIV